MRWNDDSLIPQEDLWYLAEMERHFLASLEILREQIEMGRRCEPGNISINYAALISPFPQVAFDLSKPADKTRIDEFVLARFGPLKILLSDVQVDELRAAGKSAIASRLRRSNRRVYRSLLNLYLRHTIWTLHRHVVSNQAQFEPSIIDFLHLRGLLLKMGFAAFIHLLRIGNPARIATEAMRSIDFLLNRTDVPPTTWD